MITSCKLYITDNYAETIWSMPQDVVRKKLDDCIRLNVQYQFQFQETKKKLEKNPAQRQFDFSEVYMFGKFESFVRRLKKILEMFDIINIYSNLTATKIEGNLIFFKIII